MERMENILQYNKLYQSFMEITISACFVQIKYNDYIKHTTVTKIDKDQNNVKTLFTLCVRISHRIRIRIMKMYC